MINKSEIEQHLFRIRESLAVIERMMGIEPTNPHPPENDLAPGYTYAEAAKRLGLTAATVKRIADNNQIPVIRMGPKKNFIKRWDIEKFINRRYRHAHFSYDLRDPWERLGK